MSYVDSYLITGLIPTTNIVITTTNNFNIIIKIATISNHMIIIIHIPLNQTIIYICYTATIAEKIFFFFSIYSIWYFSDLTSHVIYGGLSINVIEVLTHSLPRWDVAGDRNLSQIQRDFQVSYNKNVYYTKLKPWELSNYRVQDAVLLCSSVLELIIE